MTKRVVEVALGTRNARLKLPPRHKPYFRLVEEGVHLGYRRSTVAGRAGTWLARRYLGAARYETEILGVADDLPAAPENVTPLPYDEAVRAAREWARRQAAAARASKDAEGTVTVRRAVTDYIATRIARSARAGRDAELRLTHHVLAAPLADIALAGLTSGDLVRWREGLRRGGRGVKDGAADLAPATLARLLNDLRAALNAAARKARVTSDVLTSVREGLRAPESPVRARDMQLLPDADVRRVVEAAFAQDADFGALVLVLAATGCRFDQAARLTVADLQFANERLMVPTSRKGRGLKARTHIAVPLPADALARLRPLVAARRGNAPLLLRWHHKQIEGDKATGRLPEWVQTERRSWRLAAEMTRPWRAALTAAGLPGDLIPYCLRHSSIVRGLRVGLPVRLVAAAHDTSVAMIEKHYAAFIVDATEDLLRRALVPLAPAAPPSLKGTE
jgi:integrase